MASTSPRRKEFFNLLGLKVEIVPSGVVEGDLSGNPGRLPLWMTVQKLKGVRPKLGKDFVGWIVAADTMVALGREIFGKPKNRAQAKEMLSRLAGKRHKVYTGYRVQTGKGNFREGVAETAVEIVPMTEAQIDWYVGTGEADDKAGAYAIQGKGGMFVRSIFGSYSNVVGLPMHEVIGALRELGAIQD